jgi:adenylate kinase family enzyme
MEHAAREHRAVLLVGPTGSGKTPLGDLIAERGLWGAPCVHFDFGASLRAAVERDRPDEVLGRDDIEFLRGVLRSGRLLEDEQFPLAERILRSFLARSGADAETVVVMNGLPRHVGQAEAVDAIVHVVAVVLLRCSGEVIRERIRANVGGDRTDRADDDPESVRRKLALFVERTVRLVEHYRRLGAGIEPIDVTATMTPAEMWHILNPSVEDGDASGPSNNTAV